MKNFESSNLRCIGLAARLVSAAVIICFLYYGRVVLVPIALAVLIAFALLPVVKKLVRWHLPRGLSVGIVMAFLIITIGSLGWFIGGQLTGFARELPYYQDNIAEKIRDTRQMFSGGLLDKLADTISGASAQAGVASDAAPDAAADNPAEPKTTTASEWLSSIDAVTDPLTTFALVALLVAMILLQWSDLRSRLLGLLAGQVSRTTNALADAGKHVGHFLFLQFVYNTSFGIVIGLALWAMGVPYSGLWGLCAGLFRYVPYVGPLAATVLPLAVTLVTSSGWSQVIAVGSMFLVLELISNNFIEPWLYGSKLGVSEIGIVIASVAWTYLWGPIGLLLATPLTVCLVVLGKHVPPLAFLSKILGNDDILSGPENYYQRLLAGDTVEAVGRAQKLIKEIGRTAFVTGTLLPALALARRDQVEGLLNESNNQSLLMEVEAVSDLISNKEESAAEKNDVSAPSDAVVIWSTCPLTDAVLPILESELQPGTFVIVRSTELVGGALQRFGSDSDKPKAISVLHLSDVDTPRAFSVLKRIKKVLPDVPVQLSRLGEETFTDSERSTLSAASSHASSIAETRSWANAYASAVSV